MYMHPMYFMPPPILTTANHDVFVEIFIESSNSSTLIYTDEWNKEDLKYWAGYVDAGQLLLTVLSFHQILIFVSTLYSWLAEI